MGVSIYVGHVEIKSVEQFPFLKAVLEKNTIKRNVLGLECYVWQDFEGEAIYDWDTSVEGISDKQKKKEMKNVRKNMDKEYYWEESDDKESEYYENENNYIRYMCECDNRINSYTASVDL